MKRWTGFAQFSNGRYWSTSFEVDVTAGTLAVAMHRAASAGIAALRAYERSKGRSTHIRAAKVTVAYAGPVKRSAESTDGGGS